jgi:tRNA(Ile)-lysidine synthase
MDKLVQHILAQWPEQFAGHFTFAVGLSGGIDSVVLLHALAQIRQIKSLSLSAIHINHGISPHASTWQEFCKTLCTSLAVPLTIRHYTVIKTGGESLENKARQVRYSAFATLEAQVIALAHHQNDQIETTLSQICRGSDLHNIGAMQVISLKQTKVVWRPLLEVPKVQIQAYAKQYGLAYIQDESNLDIKFLRNFIRQDILPRLITWDNTIGNKILNFTRQLQNTLKLVDQIAAEDLTRLLIATTATAVIDLAQFKTLSHERQFNVLSYFLKQQHLPLPSHKQIREFIHQAVTSQWDKRPQLKLTDKHKLIKHKNQILLQI